MNSFSFPDMINKTSGRFIEVSGRDATAQNLRLLLLSSKTSLLGDPYFGTNLKKLLFNPRDIVIKDLVIDEIYTAVSIFMPEITITRNDIKIEEQMGKLIVSINAIHNNSMARSLFTIPLLNIEELA
jgi:phage baseplate assembly protein W